MTFWIIIGVLVYITGAAGLTAIDAIFDDEIDEWGCGTMGLLWPVIVPFPLLVVLGVLIFVGPNYLLSFLAKGVRNLGGR